MSTFRRRQNETKLATTGGTPVEVISKVFSAVFRGILRPFRPPNGLSKFSGQIWILTKDEIEADFSGAIIVDVLYYDS